jgi:TonB-linked SusC/RagA family outer membrane protein
MRRFGRLTRALVGAAAVLVAAATTASAQSPSIAGRVTDKNARPVVGARVTVIGTSTVVNTNSEGRYAIRVPVSGEFRLRVNAIGYESQTKGGTAGTETVTLDFELASAVVQIDEIVTTATGEQSRLEVGTTIATISADSIAATQPVTNLADVLNSRAPGVTVQTSGGTTGGGSRIRIRGANSLSLSNEPIYYVDGVRVSNGANSNSNGVGGQSQSRLNDFNPDEIESIEVVKGPAAASLYGPDAANGVIVIKTKKGKAGRTLWNFYTEQGIVQDKNKYPANYMGWGTFDRGTPDEFAAPGCTVGGENLFFGGACEFDSVTAFSPLRDPTLSPYANGRRQQYGLNVSGGNEAVRFFVSGDFENEDGVLRMPLAEQDSVALARNIAQVPIEQARPNAVRRINLRSNVSAQLTPKLDLAANIGYGTSRIRLPQNDNNILGILGNAFGGYPQNETLQDFGFPVFGFGITPASAFSILNRQNNQRFTTSLTANWRPTSQLTGRAAFGLDQTQQYDLEFGAAGQAPSFGDFARGTRSENRFTITQYTVDLGLTANTKLTDRISSRTSIGGQMFRTTAGGTFATGNGIAAGSGTLNGAVQQLVGSTNTGETSVGAFFEQQFGIDEKLYISGGARLDNSTFLENSDGAVILPKAQISYVARADRPGTLNLLRFRGAYGQAIVQPGYFSLLRSFAPVVAVAPTGTVNAITFNGLGNPGLRPERSREFEIGADATLLDNRVTLQLTAYDKRTKDALISRITPPSLGASATFFDNLASVQNQGFEAQIDAQVLRARNATFDLTLSGNLFKNRIRELGDTVPILIGFTQQHRTGFQTGSFWDRTVQPTGASFDANGDGIITSDEVTVSDTLEFQGNFLPTRELNAFTALGLFDGKIRITSQWNYRGGNSLDNSTEQFRCGAFANCRGLYDPTAPIEDQAKANQAFLLNGYVERADFLRLREVAVTFTAPDKLARALGGSRLSLTVAGRNLALWTKYNGVDPEANNFGQANFATSDFLTQPPVRYWTARVNLGF